MIMKKVDAFIKVACQWVMTLCVFSVAMVALTSCGGDGDEPKKTDDLAYLKQRISPEGDLGYGVYLGGNTEVLFRPIQTEDDALKEFYLLLKDGSAHKGLQTEADAISCRLTGTDGQYQGTITFSKPQGTFTGYCAEVVFSNEVAAATGLTRIRYVLADMWPPSDTGFISDILDKLKK